MPKIYKVKLLSEHTSRANPVIFFMFRLWCLHHVFAIIWPEKMSFCKGRIEGSLALGAGKGSQTVNPWLECAVAAEFARDGSLKYCRLFRAVQTGHCTVQTRETRLPPILSWTTRTLRPKIGGYFANYIVVLEV